MTKTERYKERLKHIRFLYNENFKNLLSSMGKPEHEKYARIEKCLDLKETEIMKRLGYPINPCPINTAKFCTECTGYYKPRKENSKSMKECTPDETATKCFLK